ncbi:MAG: DUF1080 domain-containing protein [Planctomycetia bacterium]|nr:DUF1080 domain-containing protein [Planctomycetia bacterium]
MNVRRTLASLVAAPLVPLALAAVLVAADKSPAFTDPADAGPDYKIQGEYVGELHGDDGAAKVGVQIVALGEGKFDGVLYPGGLPGAGWDQSAGRQSYAGAMKDGAAVFDAGGTVGKAAGGVLTVTDADGKKVGELKRVDRQSSTMGAKPPAGAVVLFDGTTADKWNGGRLTDGGLLAAGCTSKQEFKDFQLHAEFQTPFMPAARGQGRGNSGVYLQNRYEVQVLDSFGLEGKDNECGGFYSIKAPRENMCYPPLAWQTYDVDFTAARFDTDGKKTKNAVVTVRHNGVPIYENFELPKVTPGGAPQETPGVGPLQLQDHGNPVRYRNIWVVEKK